MTPTPPPNPTLPLLHSLHVYRETWGQYFLSDYGVAGALEKRFIDLLGSPACFDRAHLPGHLTGSALVVSPDGKEVLLTHHRKLNRWLQLGGHADGDPRLDKVALREAEEESGLTGLSFLPFGKAFGMPGDGRLIFDLDLHRIPAHKEDPEHEHYDVRFLLVASEPERLVCSEESHELRWFTIDDATRVTRERGMHRLFEKLRFLQERL